MQDLQVLDPRERRRRTRFPIELGARYAAKGRQEIEGAGRTVNISSDGVLLTSEHELALGTSIRVVIEWPILIGEICALALHVRGKVVRSDRDLVAVRFSSHELRTQSKSPERLLGVSEWRAKTAS